MTTPDKVQKPDRHSIETPVVVDVDPDPMMSQIIERGDNTTNQETR